MTTDMENIYIVTYYHVGMETFEVVGHYSSHFLALMAKERQMQLSKVKGIDIEVTIWASEIDSDKAVELT